MLRMMNVRKLVMCYEMFIFIVIIVNMCYIYVMKFHLVASVDDNNTD